MPLYAPEKTMYVAPFGAVDIFPYKPLLRTREIQGMKYRSQLSLVREVCANATHTRFAHTIGVLGLLNQMLDSLFRRGFFEDEDQNMLRKRLSVSAVCHDVGHPPYSHIAEAVLSQLGSFKSHRERTLHLVNGPLAKSIDQCGVSVESVVSMLDKSKDQRGRLVWDKSIGADKIGYLYHDQRQTGHNVSMPTTYAELLEYVCFVDDKVCMEEKSSQFLEGLQRMYSEMWLHVYFRKGAVLFGRMLQKAIQLHIEKSEDDADAYWEKPEGWLDTKLSESKSEDARRLQERIMDRHGLKSSVVFKHEKYVDSERIAGKPIEVRGVPESSYSQLLNFYANPLKTTELENCIAKELNVYPWAIVVAAPPEPNKVAPEDIYLVNKRGERVGTLFGRSPELLPSLRENANKELALRVAVAKSQRTRISQAAKDISAIVQEHSGIKLN